MDPMRVSLAALSRGPVHASWRIQDPAAELGDLPLGLSAVEVEVTLSEAAKDGIRAQGTIRTGAEMKCRRCLDPTPVSITADLDAWFRPPSEVTPGEEGVWALDVTGEVDLRGPVREELWVAVPAFVECGADCRGLCPHCGARLVVEDCTCPPPERDPRWAALLDLDG